MAGFGDRPPGAGVGDGFGAAAAEDGDDLHLFALPLVVSMIHYPGRAPLRRPTVAALLLGVLWDNRRHRGRLAVVVERHVGDVTRIGVALVTGEHVLRDDLHAHFHRGLAGEIHARVGGDQLAHVDRLAKVHFVDRDSDALATRVADRTHRGDAVHQ